MRTINNVVIVTVLVQARSTHCNVDAIVTRAQRIDNDNYYYCFEEILRIRQRYCADTRMHRKLLPSFCTHRMY